MTKVNSVNAGQAQRHRAEEGDEDAKLGRRTEQEALGVGDQRAEIGHAADAQEDQRRVNAEFHALVQIPKQPAGFKMLPVILAVHFKNRVYLVVYPLL